MTDTPVSRLLADEMMSPDLLRRIRLLGHDVETVRSLNVEKSGDGWEDIDVLQEAIVRRMAVLTDNVKHFKPLSDQMPWHNGIIACAFDIDYQRKAKAIDKAIRDAVDLRGKWIYVPCVEPEKPKRKRKGKVKKG